MTSHARVRSCAAPHPATARPDASVHRMRKCRTHARRRPADAQSAELGQAGGRIGQRGDRRVRDVPAWPNFTTSHARIRSRAAPHPATPRPHPAFTGRASAASTRAGARRTHRYPSLDRLPSDSGSAAIGVSAISLHGRTHDVKQTCILSRAAPYPAAARLSQRCTVAQVPKVAGRCPADAQMNEIRQACERLG
jgi:hypothetical protein